MPDNEKFIAFEKDGLLYWRDMRTNETMEIGVTQKTFKVVQDALESAIKERDEYFEMLVVAGLLERPRDPQDVASEALEEARAARAESTRMADMLQQILARLESTPSHTAQPEQEPDPKPTHAQPNENGKGGKR